MKKAILSLSLFTFCCLISVNSISQQYQVKLDSLIEQTKTSNSGDFLNAHLFTYNYAFDKNEVSRKIYDFDQREDTLKYWHQKTIFNTEGLILIDTVIYNPEYGAKKIDHYIYDQQNRLDKKTSKYTYYFVIWNEVSTPAYQVREEYFDDDERITEEKIVTHHFYTDEVLSTGNTIYEYNSKGRILSKITNVNPTGETPYISAKETYEYNSVGLLLEFTFFDFDRESQELYLKSSINKEYSEQGRTETKYDLAGENSGLKLETIVISNFNNNDQALRVETKSKRTGLSSIDTDIDYNITYLTINEFDEHDIQKSKIQFSDWNQNLNAFHHANKDVWYYNENNLLLKREKFFSFDASADVNAIEWILCFEEIKEYDELENVKISYLGYGKNSLGDFEPKKYRTEYFYNDDDQLKLRKHYILANEQGADYDQTGYTEYLYNDNKKEIFSNYFEKVNDKFELRNYVEKEYDHLGFQIGEIIERWDLEQEEFEMYSKFNSTLDYDVSNENLLIVGPDEVLKKVFKSYPFICSEFVSDSYSSGYKLNFYYSDYNGPQTGIEEVEQIPVRVYPNPSSDFVAISYPETWETGETAALYLFDVSGKLVLNKFIHNDEAINIHSLPAGEYILRMIHDDKVANGKIIVD